MNGPDPEILKLLLQGGSFGLLCILVVWVLFWGAPMLRDMLNKMSEEHRQSIEHITEECARERREMMERFQDMLERRP